MTLMSSSAAVLVGGTFACDAAIAQPLELLLTKAVSQVDVTIEWLPYASASDPATLYEPPLQHRAFDLVVLLVRLCDLASAHPEIEARSSRSSDEFYDQLLAYDTSTIPLPPLVIIFCPSPPACSTDAATVPFIDAETALRSRIQSLQRVSCRSSDDLSRGFDAASDWYDAVADRREHAPFTQRMLNAVALACTRQICRLFRPPQCQKKVVVLDCDNTLWGGAVADVGSDGVEISGRFLAVQQFALRQQQRGLLLCLCSKNIPQDVESVFARRAGAMALRLEDHIVVSKINWRAKSANIREIADELKLALDSFVFVDDNAVECHEVAAALPMVTVIHLPDGFDSHYLDDQWVFDPPLVASTPTAEDAQRTRLYQENARRSALQRSAPSRAAFLSSLGLRIAFERVSDPASAAFARVLQLLKRTNTFNTTTSFSRSVDHEALAAYAADHCVLAATVTDRYGHYGLVCVAMVRVVDAEARVDSLIMSCRVMNRGVEHAMVREIATTAQRRGAAEIVVEWEPTVRNEPARVFLGSLSCTRFDGSSGGNMAGRAEKLRHSASETGVWKLNVEDALGVSFLKEEEGSSSPWRSFLLRVARFVVAFVRRWTPLGWLLRLVAWMRSTKRVDGGSGLLPGSLLIDLASRGRLDAFLRDNGMPNGSKTDATQETDEAFRLRARYETKHLLLDHVADDAPRVVWTPQGREDVEESDALRSFHHPCKTASCTATVYWESNCELQRCRTCCYRMQRLLSRATNSAVHPRARAAAVEALQVDFNFDEEVTESREQWCVAHTNKSKK